MPNDISIDLGSLLDFGVSRVLTLLGRDPQTTELKQWLHLYMQAALHAASYVQCVGMSEPIPLTTIYRPVRLAPIRTSPGTATTAVDLLTGDDSAIIYARPGCGKTTLLSWLYCAALSDDRKAPFLFVLRWPDSVSRLLEFVAHIKTSKAFDQYKNRELLLLVDGYDEISWEDRKRVSAALRDFVATKRGRFLLTCRTFYDVYDVHALHYQLLPFTSDDVRAYLTCFANVYAGQFDPADVIDEIERSGLVEFVSHPLMLALVAILKSGPGGALPKHGLGLVQRGVDTLTLRWDQSKGVARDTALAVDGYERVRCMMRVAFRMEVGGATTEVVEHAIADQLRLFQRSDVRPPQLLQEMAQWYGILIPKEPDGWTFSHRTMHDFLAAKFWVESGTFTPSSVSEWSPRAAYAACMVPDATAALTAAFEMEDAWSVLGECVMNGASFDVAAVAPLIVRHFASHWALPGVTLTTGSRGRVLEGGIEDKDCFDLASTELLLELLNCYSKRPEDIDSLHLAQEVLLAVILSELRSRGVAVSLMEAQWARRRFRGRIDSFLIRRRRKVLSATVDELVAAVDTKLSHVDPVGVLTRNIEAAGLTFMRAISGRINRLRRLDWSPDGKHIAAGSADGSIKVWTNSGELVLDLADTSSKVVNLSWSLDGRYLAAAHHRLRIWDTSSGECVVRSSAGPPTFGISWLPGGGLVTSSDDGRLHLWDVVSGRVLETVRSAFGQLWSVAWHESRQCILIGTSLGTLLSWVPGSGAPVPVYRPGSAIWEVSSDHSDGTVLLALDQGRIVVLDSDFLPSRWVDVDTAVVRIAVNRHRTRLMSLCGGGALGFFGLPTLERLDIVAVPPHWQASRGLAYSPATDCLATPGATDGSIYLWSEGR